MESVFCTTDYSKFKFSPWNRDIKEKNLQKLQKNVEAEGWKCHPIIVNENYEVIDGQHRLVYARKNNLPVYYIIVNGLDASDCVDMNNARVAWSPEDFIKLFASQGNENYIRLRELLNTYDFAPVSTIVAQLKGLTSNPSLNAAIRKGTFKLTAKEAKDITEKFDFMQELKPYIKGVKGRSSAIYAAISFCYNLDIVNKGRLKKQIKTRIANITPPVDLEMALKEIEYIYNYKINQKDYVDIFTEYKKIQREKLLESSRRMTEYNERVYGNKNGKPKK